MSKHNRLSRREFLRACSAGVGALVLGSTLESCASPEKPAATEAQKPEAPPPAATKESPSQAAEPKPAASPQEALRALIAGNRRYAEGHSTYPHQDPARRVETSTGQKPFAAFLTCCDSRVPPEIIFDQGIGDIFIIRTAGNVAGNVGLGSLEYAVEHLNVTLLVILGHQKCGAVSATVQGGAAAGHIAKIVAEINPALMQAKKQGGDLLMATIDANIRLGVNRLQKTTPILSEYVDQGKIEVVGARYDLDTGLVTWLEGSPAMKSLFPG